jgi:hypothetical protein
MGLVHQQAGSAHPIASLEDHDLIFTQQGMPKDEVIDI